jgi:hypothetical protein
MQAEPFSGKYKMLLLLLNSYLTSVSLRLDSSKLDYNNNSSNNGNIQSHH